MSARTGKTAAKPAAKGRGKTAAKGAGKTTARTTAKTGAKPASKPARARGKAKGTVHKNTLAARERMAQLDFDPLESAIEAHNALLTAAREETDPKEQVWKWKYVSDAAGKLLPYCYPTLGKIEFDASDGAQAWMSAMAQASERVRQAARPPVPAPSTTATTAAADDEGD